MIPPVFEAIHEEKKRILLVDDHALVAETVAAFVNAQPDLMLQSCASVAAALQVISSSGAFDVVLLDYNLPGSEGLSGLTALTDANRGKVAIFSGMASRPVVERALEMGAVGYVPKTLGVRSLVNAIRFMADGEIYLPSDFIAPGLGRVEEGGVSLKPIERRVLVHLCEGSPNKEIARMVDLTEVSVKAHVKAICGKLGAKNRTQAVLIAKQKQIC